MTNDNLRYPIGRFQYTGQYTPVQRNSFIADLDTMSEDLRKSVAGLSNQQLDTPYRPDGWSVRQVVHHMADSFMNAYIRFRFGLTENNPTIKPYDQDSWAKLYDAERADVELSLKLFESLMARWIILLKSLEGSAYERTYLHLEDGIVSLDRVLGLYSWHGKHHIAQIVSLKKRMGW